jgi:quercetin dioxygenase-like cupin family protein
MKLKHYSDVPKQDVTDYSSTGTSIRWLITKEEDNAPRFTLRRFEIEPGGQIGIHNHPQEHEIYCLRGEGEVFTHYERVTMKKDDVLFVPPDEPHGYKNKGNEPFVFLCVIPYL